MRPDIWKAAPVTRKPLLKKLDAIASPLNRTALLHMMTQRHRILVIVCSRFVTSRVLGAREISQILFVSACGLLDLLQWIFSVELHRRITALSQAIFVWASAAPDIDRV